MNYLQTDNSFVSLINREVFNQKLLLKTLAIISESPSAHSACEAHRLERWQLSSCYKTAGLLRTSVTKVVRSFGCLSISQGFLLTGMNRPS